MNPYQREDLDGEAEGGEDGEAEGGKGLSHPKGEGGEGKGGEGKGGEGKGGEGKGGEGGGKSRKSAGASALATAKAVRAVARNRPRSITRRSQ